MEAHRRTDFGPRGLRLRGGDAPREIDFFTAEVHYWRLARAAWPACLAAVRRLGFELVATCVPWSAHERDGRLDWSGNRDLAGFLAEVDRAGLQAVLRAGPLAGAELTHLGLPERVVRDPAMRALSARGAPVWLPVPPHMFPLPSFASTAFRAAATTWLRAFAEVVLPHRFPDGPVVAFDGAPAVPFRLGAYDHDYHPDALAWWREHAGDVEPPRAWDARGADRCVAWVRFKEEVYGARALAWVREALDAAGLDGLARTHAAIADGANLAAAARAIGGPAGVSFATTRDAREVRRRALHLGASAEPLPIAGDVATGGSAWFAPIPVDEQARIAAGILAGGARGLSFAMAVDRDRWIDAPIAADGSARPSASWLAQLLAGLRAVEWTSLRRRRRVAVIASRAEARFAAASSLGDPILQVVTELVGPRLGRGGEAELARDPAPSAHRRWTESIVDALDRAGIPFALLDEEASDPAWQAHAAFVVPTLGRVDRALWRRLRDAAERGATVIAGPERPARDELDQPLGDDARLPRRLGLMQPGSVDDIDGLARDLAAALGGEADWRVDPPAPLSLFEDATGAVRALVVENPASRPARLRLTAPAGAALRDPWTGAISPGDAGAIALELDPGAVRFFAVEGGRPC